MIFKKKKKEYLGIHQILNFFLKLKNNKKMAVKKTFLFTKKCFVNLAPGF